MVLDPSKAKSFRVGIYGCYYKAIIVKQVIDAFRIAKIE